MREKLAIAILAMALLVLSGYALFQLSKSRTFQFFGGLTSRVQTDRPVAAITFDDAPSEYSDQVVSILSEKGIPATFYAIGQNIEKYPEETKNIVRQGSELGNHTYSHQPLVLQPLSFIDNEIQKTSQLIRQAGYPGEITFRPPNGKKFIGLPWYLHEHNMKTIMWDVEPDTLFQGDAEAIVKDALEHTQPGSIILLHPFCKTECAADRQALPKIIDGLREQGYSFATISELLALASH